MDQATDNTDNIREAGPNGNRVKNLWDYTFIVLQVIILPLE